MKEKHLNEILSNDLLSEMETLKIYGGNGGGDPQGDPANVCTILNYNCPDKCASKNNYEGCKG